MWIRSQSKKELVESRNIFIEGESIFAYESNQVVLIGKYATEDRAKEVMDNLQAQIIKGTSRDYLYGKNRIFQSFVFVMPGV